MEKLSMKLGLVFVLSLGFFGFLGKVSPSPQASTGSSSMTMTISQSYTGGTGPTMRHFTTTSYGNRYTGYLKLVRINYTRAGTICYYSGTVTSSWR